MVERKITAYKSYYKDFMATLTVEVRKKIHYGLDLLISQERVNKKFVKYVRDGLYELRAEYEGNIYRLFFVFDEGRVVVLFNGFQKKTQKTPENEISKALTIKNEYYGSK
jgi:phage-related protein